MGDICATADWNAWSSRFLDLDLEEVVGCWYLERADLSGGGGGSIDLVLKLEVLALDRF